MPDRISAEFICTTMNSNHKQTALITGASSGIGLGLTRGFLEAGFNVVANSRNVTGSQALIPRNDLLLVDGDVGESATAYCAEIRMCFRRDKSDRLLLPQILECLSAC